MLATQFTWDQWLRNQNTSDKRSCSLLCDRHVKTMGSFRNYYSTSTCQRHNALFTNDGPLKLLKYPWTRSNILPAAALWKLAKSAKPGEVGAAVGLVVLLSPPKRSGNITDVIISTQEHTIMHTLYSMCVNYLFGRRKFLRFYFYLFFAGCYWSLRHCADNRHDQTSSVFWIYSDFKCTNLHLNI